MDKNISDIVAFTNNLQLTKTEKAGVRGVLTTTMAASGMVLSAAERVNGREHLLGFMEQNGRVTFNLRSIASVVKTFFRMPMLALGLVLLVTTSVAAAADSVLPGSFLYPVKLHVTEPIQKLLLRTPERRTEWELKRLERRITEAKDIMNRTSTSDPTMMNGVQTQSTILTEALDKEPAHNKRAIMEKALEALMEHENFVAKHSKPSEEQKEVLRILSTEAERFREPELQTTPEHASKELQPDSLSLPPPADQPVPAIKEQENKP